MFIVDVSTQFINSLISSFWIIVTYILPGDVAKSF